MLNPTHFTLLPGLPHCGRGFREHIDLCLINLSIFDSVQVHVLHNWILRKGVIPHCRIHRMRMWVSTNSERCRSFDEWLTDYDRQGSFRPRSHCVILCGLLWLIVPLSIMGIDWTWDNFYNGRPRGPGLVLSCCGGAVKCHG